MVKPTFSIKYSQLFIVLFGVLFLGSCSVFKPSSKKNSNAGADTIVKVKPYEKIIKKNAVSQQGLIDIHKVDTKYYFEIPTELLGKEMLVVTRFIKTPAGAENYGGEEISKKVMYFEKTAFDKILIRISTFINYVSVDDAIATAVENSNVTPIIAAFDIKATNDKTGANVIDVTDFINSNNSLFALSHKEMESYKLSGIEKDKSYINQINTYAINTEIKTVKTYKSKASANDPRKDLPAAVMTGMVTLEINSSIILLPKTPMRKRFYDPRVGYFASSYLKYGDDQQRVQRDIYIHRWRLEPKEEDIEAWKKGELVEPKKPIVYYIDPATPKKWVPYLIEGINDWQVAFEQAGFKNAIVGKEWPINDPTMSLEDARFSVIRYFASAKQNAYGPNIVDPRSGEILESHIGWYHNLMKLLHTWYVVQAGAVDLRAHQMNFDDKLMGQLIRFVSSHEVGHTLGLRHNMGASYATPVEKLRDENWLKINGHTSSIMDYARFNYVAQPEDNINPNYLMPKIGDYDKWAIQWGYMKFTDEITAEEEITILNKMVVDSVSSNKRLWFGGEGRDLDPRSQTEDLGDNSMLASRYGIKNLKRIVPELPKWTMTRTSDDYSNLDELYKAVVGQFDKYLMHVANTIGGVYISPKTMGEKDDVYTFIPKKTQQEALAFLNEFIFNKPTWLLNDAILNNTKAPQGKDQVTIIMEGMMANLLGAGLISRMGYIAERQGTEDSYLPQDYLDDLFKMCWSDLDRNYNPDIYRRHLQKSFVVNLIALYKPEKVTKGLIGLVAILSKSLSSNTDTRALAYSYLISLHKKIQQTIPYVSDRMNLAHLQYLEKEVSDALQEVKKVL